MFLPLRGVPTPVPSDRARRPWPDASAQSLRGRVRDHKARAPPRMAVRGAHRARRGRAHGLHPAAKPRTPLERKGAREPVPPPPTQWRGTGVSDAVASPPTPSRGTGLTALRRCRRATGADALCRNDGPGAALRHPWRQGRDEAGRHLHVERIHAVKHVFRHGMRRPARGDPGMVDQYIDLAVAALDGSVRHGTRARRVAQVSRKNIRCAACGTDVRHHLPPCTAYWSWHDSCSTTETKGRMTHHTVQRRSACTQQ